jgi:hypothetical protein
MTGFWEVPPSDVESIDRALLAFLRTQKVDASHLQLYRRQYLGFRRGARRYVFINAIPPSMSVTPESAEGELIAVCDDTWGVEYDVGTQTFSHLGIDSGPPLHQ